MGIQIGAKPDSGFDDPLGMLVDCHRRIEHFLQILSLVAGRARGRALMDEERAAVEASLQYFRVGGQRHNADEEDSLFPRLRAASGGDTEQIGSLENDHRRADTWHATIAELFRRWIVSGRLSTSDEERLIAVTTQLKELYEAHIRLEERVVFPRAAAALNPMALAAIGEEFRVRRS